MQDWLKWQMDVDEKFGAKAKELVTGKYPIAGPVLDAVHLVLQTANTLGAIFGKSGTRPIGSTLVHTTFNNYQ
jgi:hypothetical protein